MLRKKLYKAKSKKIKLPSLSGSQKRIINYWREALSLEEKIENLLSLDNEYTIDIEKAELEKASLMPNTLSLLKKTLEGLKLGSNLNKNNPLPAYLCPISLENKKMLFRPFYIPATVSSSGQLHPPKNTFAFFMREFLDPSPAINYPIIGEVDDSKKIDKFANSYSSFSKYLGKCESYFKNVTGFTYEGLDLEGWDCINHFALIPDPSSSSSSKNLIKILGEVLEKKRHPGCIRAISEIKKSSKKENSYTKYKLYSDAKKHLAHISPEHSLSISQRDAVYKCRNLKEYEIYPVTGPPGTGKTTVLQSFILNNWVSSALNQSEYPSLQVVCGATNQSVLNVINAFEQSSNHQNNSILYKRWLPKVHSLGTFCSSFSKSKEVESYQIELLDGQGFSNLIEKEDFIESAEKFFLDCFNSFFKETRSIKTALETILAQLKEESKKLFSELQKIHKIGLKDILLSILSHSKKDELKNYHSYLQNLDTGIRHDLFVLAMHYWEARWLIETRKELKARAKKNDLKLKLRSKPNDWKLRAMITPVFVSTTGSVGKFFSHPNHRDEPIIDILYFDEAGQIPTEKAAPVMCLAKKTVCIGDTNQLEPYTVISEPLDQILLYDLKITKDLDNYEEFINLTNLGIPASSGNIMSCALSISKTKNNVDTGSFLTEHRRSVPKIISFCNELSYHGMLNPLRKEIQDRVLPAMGFFKIESPSQKAGQSRKNLKEAEQIIDFIKNYENKILDKYQVDDLSQVLAVITPFTAQVKIFEDHLRYRYPSMIIGTINSLQGAEKEIVLFSSVYSKSDFHEKVFDKSPRLLNVAVSRAKDSFILFGCMDIFNKDSEVKSPSTLLAKHLTEKL